MVGEDPLLSAGRVKRNEIVKISLLFPEKPVQMKRDRI